MSKQAYIFEVSDQSFDKYVIGNSSKTPVFVTFMNTWSEPCFQTAELFANLAKEFAEEFIFAKVDIDENEQLTQKYAINNAPTLKVFIDGKVVTTEEGQLSESEARAILKQFDIVNSTEETRMLARQHHMQGETQQAILLLTDAIRQDPSNIKIALDMVQIFIDLKELEQANNLFNRFPEKVKNSSTGLSLSGQLWIIEQASKTPGIDTLKDTLLKNPDDYDARFDMAVCEIAQHNIEEALDHLFYVLQHNPDFKDGAAREMIVTVINTIAPNDPQMAQQFRTQLATMLSA